MAEGIVIGNLQIPIAKGQKGDTGEAGKIISISLVMLSPTATPYATNTGTQTDAVIELGVPRGLAVSTVNINASGELVFTFNDGTSSNVGQVVGKGISEVTVTEDFDFVVTYTDGTSVTACNLEDEVLGTINDILESYYTKTEIDNKGFITKEVNNLTNYTLKTSTGSSIELSINSSTYVMTLNLKNSAGTVISTGTVDLPLETMVVGATYDNTNKKIVLTLKNGSTIDVPVADLVSGLQSEITSSNKLSADLVDDTSTTHKFTSTSEKSSWNAKYDKPSGGIPSTDMSSGVQASLGKADTAIQDVSGKEDTSNKTGILDENSTDTQYPNAKTVYDNFVTRDEEIEELQTENAQLLADHPDILDENNEFPSGTDLTLQGTGDLKMKVDVGGNSTQVFPDIYQAVEYIESTGTQYIDTGVVPNVNTGIDIKSSLSIENNSDKILVGSRYANNRFWIDFDGSLSSDPSIIVGYGLYQKMANYNIDTLYDIKLNINGNKKIIINSIEYSFENLNYNPMSTTMYLFGANYDTQFLGAFKLYHVNIYNGIDLVRKFIPCYRKSDNVIGLYDLVNDKFYTNQGTGTFLKGNDIVFLNPTYKQDINNVEGDVEVKGSSKNLWKPYNNTGSGVTLSYNSITKKIKITGTLSSSAINLSPRFQSLDYFNLKTGQNYTIKSEGIKNTNIKVGISIYIDNTVITYVESNNNTKQLTIPIDANRIYPFIQCNGQGTVFDEEFTIQLEKGTTATPFVPFAENTATFPLSQGQKLMLGDTLEDDGIHHKRTQTTFTGTTVTLSNAKTNGAYLCDQKTSGNLNGQTLTFDNAVTNAVIEYELATETITPYTSAQQTAYNKLKEMQSYYDLTYVVGSSDNAQPILTVQAKKSLKVINDEISNINSRLTLLEE